MINSLSFISTSPLHPTVQARISTTVLYYVVRTHLTASRQSNQHLTYYKQSIPSSFFNAERLNDDIDTHRGTGNRQYKQNQHNQPQQNSLKPCCLQQIYCRTMGTCQHEKLANRPSRRDPSSDTASTDSYDQPDAEAIQSAVTAQTIRSQGRTPSDVNHSQNGSIPTKKLQRDNTHLETSPDQHDSQPDSSSVKNNREIQIQIQPNLKVQGPSTFNEEIIKRWHEEDYSPEQLFPPIDYARIFISQ